MLVGFSRYGDTPAGLSSWVGNKISKLSTYFSFPQVHETIVDDDKM